MSVREDRMDQRKSVTGASTKGSQSGLSSKVGCSGMLSNECLGISGQSIPFVKKSLLDPHLSVLELLEKACDMPQAREVDGNVELLQATDMEKSISKSWQAIQRSENCISVMPERSNSRATGTGILSSSDTSEEETDITHSPLVEDIQQRHDQLRSLTDLGAVPINVPLYLPEVGGFKSIKTNNGDDETMVKSLTSSSNSFVMPKLSLSQKSQKFRILILGKPGLKFYQSIPKRYKDLFELARFQEPSDYRQYTGILIVFQELKEMVYLLSLVCQNSPTRPIIPVCQTGQRQQVKNVLNSMSKSRLVSLLYPPVVVSNHSDMNKLYKFLQDLSRSLSDNSEYENDESDVQNEKLKKSLHRKKKRLYGTGKHEKGDKEVKKGEKMNRWVLWGISLTVGVGIGYFMSCFVSTAWISVTTKALGPLEAYIGDKKFIVFEDSQLELGDHQPDGDGTFSHVFGMFKETLKQCNGALKRFFNKNLSLIEELARFNREDWTDESTNRIFALGYILL